MIIRITGKEQKKELHGLNLYIRETLMFENEYIQGLFEGEHGGLSKDHIIFTKRTTISFQDVSKEEDLFIKEALILHLDSLLDTIYAKIVAAKVNFHPSKIKGMPKGVLDRPSTPFSYEFYNTSPIDFQRTVFYRDFLSGISDSYKLDFENVKPINVVRDYE